MSKTKSNGKRTYSPEELERRSQLAKNLVKVGKLGGDRSKEGAGRRRQWPDRLRATLAAAVEKQLQDLSYLPEKMKEHRDYLDGMVTAIRLHPPLERDRLVWVAKALLEECMSTKRLPKVVRIMKEEDSRGLVATLLWHPGRIASIKTFGTTTFNVHEVIAEALPKLTGRELCEVILFCSYIRLRPSTLPGEEPFKDELDLASDAILFDDIGASVYEAVRAELELREVASAD